jgi:FkbM family methyltransferase
MLINFSNLYKKYNMNITGIIHIGAHYGEELEEYQMNSISDVVLFEPLSSNFRILEQRAAQFNMNIIGHQVALGNCNGEVEMFLSSNQQESSSILKPKKHLEQYPHITFNDVESVLLCKLDDYGYQNYNFINTNNSSNSSPPCHTGTNEYPYQHPSSTYYQSHQFVPIAANAITNYSNCGTSSSSNGAANFLPTTMKQIMTSSPLSNNSVDSSSATNVLSQF